MQIKEKVFSKHGSWFVFEMKTNSRFKNSPDTETQKYLIKSSLAT